MNCRESQVSTKVTRTATHGRLAFYRLSPSRRVNVRRAFCLALSAQFALSMTALAAFAEGESLTNSTLPVSQPAPSRLVQKIWSSLDLRKMRAKTTDTTTSQVEDSTRTAGSASAVAEPENASIEPSANASTEPAKSISIEPSANTATETAKSIITEPSANASETAANITVDTSANKPNTADEASSTSRGVTGTAQMIFTTGSEKTAGNATVESASDDKPFKIASVMSMVSLPPGAVLPRVQGSDDGVIIVDNDEAQEVEETLKSETMPVTENGATHARAGARFPIVLSSQISSKTAREGDPVKARLKYDLKIGDKQVAQKGSIVNGHVNYVLHARTIMQSLLSPERWYRNSGCLGLSFDEIVNEKGEHLPLAATPSRQARIVKNKAEGRELGVNHNGQIAGPWSEQLRYKAIRVGLNFALAPAGVFSFGAMPVALGVLGAANPSFAFSKPIGLNVRHRRLKGFAWGFLSGVPGSFLIEDTTIKGQEAIVKPGDEFYAELVQEFKGEPASSVELMPGSSAKVHGQILSAPRKAKKKASK